MVLRENFLYFGKDFPCPLKPRFTPSIPTIPFKDDATGKFQFSWWIFGMKSMSLMVPDDNGGFSELKIDMVDPHAADSEPLRVVGPSTNDPWADVVFVMLDTGASVRMPFCLHADNVIPAIVIAGSYGSLLPESVLDKIRDTWLLNSEDILDLPENKNVNSYCGPERNLDGCDIVFTFEGYDHKVVDFRCPAKPFLKSSTRLPSDEGSGEPPSRFCTNLGKSPPHLEQNKIFILGIVSRDFAWADPDHTF